MSAASSGAIAVPVGKDRAALLASLELLDRLADDARGVLERDVRWIEVPAGEVVFREGDPSDSVYFVAHGRLAILQRDASGCDRPIREVGVGQPIGELGLLLGRTRSATAMALRDSLLVRLDRKGFEGLIEREPAVLLPLSRRIAERLTSGGSPGEESAPPATLVVPASPTLATSRLWKDLSALLTQRGAYCMRIGELAESCGSPRGLELPRAVRWLEAEAHEGRPVFVLGDDLPAARELLPGIDRTLLVADAAGRVGFGPFEEHFAHLAERGVPARLDLVLLQRHACEQPEGSAAWLERIRPARHHQLRRGDRTALARLARRLTGRAVGLALGGGGARAFAHIGAIRALREAGVPIDLVAGTNIGAVVGAQLALGWDPERMLEVNRRVWPPLGRDLSLPFVSLLGGRRLRRALDRMFGDVRIEDLWLDYRCETVDLSWCHPVTHGRGPLQRWVRASVSVPGIHPPVVDAGRLHVDGGLLESVPDGSLRERGAGTVISIDPSPFRRQTVDARIEEAPAGLDFLLHSLPVVGSGFPGIRSLIYRALSVMQQSHREERRRRSDLYVEPPVDRFGATDYGDIAEISALGYEETKRRLEDDGPPRVD